MNLPSKSAVFAHRGGTREKPPPPTQIRWAYADEAAASRAATIATASRRVRPSITSPERPNG